MLGRLKLEDKASQIKTEIAAAQQLAARYHFDFVDLRDCRPDTELLRSIPLDLMLHYQFLPLEAADHRLVIAIVDPTDLARLDELEMKLDRKLVIRVAARLPEKDGALPARSG
jgi:hypothetical protein